MVASNANIYVPDLKIWIGTKTIIQCCFDCLDGFVNVEHLPVLNTIGISLAKSKYFQFSEFIFPSGNDSNLGCPNVKTNDNGLFSVHKFGFSCCFIESDLFFARPCLCCLPFLQAMDW